MAMWTSVRHGICQHEARSRGEVTFRSAVSSQQSMDFVSLLLVQQRQLSGSSTLNADTYPCYRFGKVALILFN